MIINAKGIFIQTQLPSRERDDIEAHCQVSRMSRKIVLGRQENLLLFFVIDRLFGKTKNLLGARAHLDKD